MKVAANEQALVTMSEGVHERLLLPGPTEPVETAYRVGCSSWLDPSLLAAGTFYPDPKMTAEDRLRWYARFFNCVEVNAT